MEVGGLRTAESLLCVKGMRELDTEVWQKGEFKKEKRRAGKQCDSDISVDSCYFQSTFSALHFASIPTMPQLLFSKKATMTDDYSLQATVSRGPLARLLSGMFDYSSH